VCDWNLVFRDGVVHAAWLDCTGAVCDLVGEERGEYSSEAEIGEEGVDIIGLLQFEAGEQPVRLLHFSKADTKINLSYIRSTRYYRARLRRVSGEVYHEKT
jgi:hypothetical protein